MCRIRVRFDRRGALEGCVCQSPLTCSMSEPKSGRGSGVCFDWHRYIQRDGGGTYTRMRGSTGWRRGHDSAFYESTQMCTAGIEQANDIDLDYQQRASATMRVTLTRSHHRIFVSPQHYHQTCEYEQAPRFPKLFKV